MDKAAITIIGIGVAGLAVAVGLSSTHRDVFVLERHDSCGGETSSHNSEAIHAGIYYTNGSLKSLLCRLESSLRDGPRPWPSQKRLRTWPPIVYKRPSFLKRMVEGHGMSIL